MNFKWFITFSVLVFNGFQSAIAFPLGNADKSFEFFDQLSRARKGLEESDAKKLIGHVFMWIYDICYFDWTTKDEVIRLLNKEVLRRNNSGITELIAKYEKGYTFYIDHIGGPLREIEEKIVNDKWDRFFLSGERREKGLNIFREANKETLINMADELPAYMYKFESEEAMVAFSKFLSRFLKELIKDIDHIQFTLKHNVSQEKIIKENPYLLKSLRNVLIHYLRNLRHQRNVLRDYDEKVIKYLKQPPNGMGGFYDFDLYNQEAILNIFDLDSTVPHCNGVIVQLRQILKSVRKDRWDNHIMIDLIKMNIIDGTWEKFCLQGQNRKNEMRSFHKATGTSVINVLEDVNDCIRNLNSSTQLQYFKFPLEHAIFYIGNVTKEMKTSIDGFENLELMKSFPSLLQPAKALFEDYIKKLDNWKATYEIELSLIVKRIKEQENALRAGKLQMISNSSRRMCPCHNTHICVLLCSRFGFDLRTKTLLVVRFFNEWGWIMYAVGYQSYFYGN
ncbi:hypothetical protein BdWA1_002271 [Babesia duncani]|uniref:Uncharacterized protein n=1 Tax=Babesia duncani TaxID=323732 RepID=A0AAD9PIY3_9APIC|nr:hypothetical protein BdWA1_002271 [Babesia duncani]